MHAMTVPHGSEHEAEAHHGAGPEMPRSHRRPVEQVLV